MEWAPKWVKSNVRAYYKGLPQKSVMGRWIGHKEDQKGASKATSGAPGVFCRLYGVQTNAKCVVLQ
jgi:hypothetical protein